MKPIKILLSLIVINLLIITICADDLNPLIYQYTNPDITVVFAEPIAASSERKQEIADAIAGITQSGLIAPEICNPDNIICTIFGHDMSDEVCVTATHHKVRQHTPRCLMEIYFVSYCKRCDYYEQELHNSVHIICCPED